MQLLHITLAMLMAAVLSAPTGVSVSGSQEAELLGTEMPQQELSEEDALYCEKQCPDGTVYICVLCNCNRLPDCPPPSGGGEE